MDNTKALGFFVVAHAALLAVLVLTGYGLSWSPYPVIILFLFALGFSFQPFFLIVPAQTSLVLENHFDGSIREVASGLVIKYPWEMAPPRNWLELNTISVGIGGEFVAKNGPRVELRGKLFWRIIPGEGTRVVKHTEKAFFSGIEQAAASFLSDYVATRNARDVRERTRDLEQLLLAHLTEGPTSLRASYGVEPTMVTITDVSFDEAYQNIRTRTSAADELTEIARRLQTGTMTDADALEAAMLVSGDVKKGIVDIRGGSSERLAAHLMAIAKTL